MIGEIQEPEQFSLVQVGTLKIEPPYWQKLSREEKVAKSQILFLLKVEIKDARIKC